MQIGYLSANPFAGDEEQFTLTPEQKRAARIRDAAPELLAALRVFANLAPYADIVDAMAECLRPHERESFRKAFETARAALAKAEG